MPAPRVVHRTPSPDEYRCRNSSAKLATSARPSTGSSFSASSSTSGACRRNRAVPFEHAIPSCGVRGRRRGLHCQALLARGAGGASAGGATPVHRSRALRAGRVRRRLRQAPGDVAGLPVEFTPTEYELLRALSLDARRSSPTKPCSARSGIGASTATLEWCTPSSSSFAPSSPIPGPARSGSSTRAASATACHGPARPPRPAAGRASRSAASLADPSRTRAARVPAPGLAQAFGSGETVRAREDSQPRTMRAHGLMCRLQN